MFKILVVDDDPEFPDIFSDSCLSVQLLPYIIYQHAARYHWQGIHP